MTHPLLAQAVTDLTRAVELLPAAHDAAWSPLRGVSYDGTPGGTGDPDDHPAGPQPADTQAHACYQRALGHLATLTGTRHATNASPTAVATTIRTLAHTLQRNPSPHQLASEDLTARTALLLQAITKAAAPPRTPRYRRCQAPRCPRPHHAKGHCLTHYQQARRNNRSTA